MMTISTAEVHMRKASEVNPLPYCDPEITLIHMIIEPLQVRQAGTVETKVNMLAEVIKHPECCLMACWHHGDDTQEMFLVDDPAAAMRQIWHE